MEDTGTYDLRALFKSIGRFGAQRALDVSPTERPKADVEIEMLDEYPAEVVAAPIEVAGFVDGIQATLCITHREQRPVYLFYVGAAALGEGARAVGVRERLALICADTDAEWVSQISVGVPVEQLVDATPPELERDAHRLVGATRDHLERTLVNELLEQGVKTLVVDGSLVGRPADRRLVGVVKTSQRQWLNDESVLWSLPEGWRSPRFKIPAGQGGMGVDRYSCYVQMADKSSGAWNLGLIRLETFDPEMLDPLAARALLERQGSRSGDMRWDRHLASVRAVEEFLRSRRPSVFALA
jgi:hypothetical protein